MTIQKVSSTAMMLPKTPVLIAAPLTVTSVPMIAAVRIVALASGSNRTSRRSLQEAMSDADLDEHERYMAEIAAQERNTDG